MAFFMTSDPLAFRKAVNKAMHIPDGYLSPQTYVPSYVAIVPIWALAANRLKQSLRQKHVPLLSLCAAFSFIIMMFNVPLAGTTGHAVGAVLIAILLGPWAATIAVSLALIVQAFLFGDGGVTAIGANCLNMAVIMPWAGWGVYRLVAGSSKITSRRRCVAGAIGGYVGLNAAALSTAIMFGIQPMIAHTADGHALYNPFGLSIAVPALLGSHLILFGFVEAIVTGLVVRYFQRTDPGLLSTYVGNADLVSANSEARQPIFKRAFGGLIALVILSPMGLYLPTKFAAGSAWGEWSANEIGKMAGYVPQQLKHTGSIWHAPLPDYAIPKQGMPHLSYIVSAVIGVAVLMLVVVLCRKLYSQGKR